MYTVQLARRGTSDEGDGDGGASISSSLLRAVSVYGFTVTTVQHMFDPDVQLQAEDQGQGSSARCARV